MAAQRKLVLLAALVAVVLLRQSTFVPAPRSMRPVAPLAGAGVAAMLGAAPAFAADKADNIGEAAKKLAGASYPFLKEVDWNSYVYYTKPGSGSAIDWVKAVDKAIVMGASMDPALLKAGVAAHHAAIGTVGKDGVTSQANYEAVLAAIGRMVASVPESQVMDVYNAFSDLTPAEVPTYLQSTVKEADAKVAYSALLDFANVVKANPVKGPVASKAADAAATKGGEFSAVANKLLPLAAQKLSDASYPFMREVDWTSDLFLKPLPGVQPSQVLKAVDKALVMGEAMDGTALQAAAMAHHKAIQSIDAKGLTSADDYAAINTALGKLIATVPTSKVMDVYTAFAGITDPLVPNQLFSTVNALDAQAAAAAFYEFKDVVKAAQR